MYRTKVWQRRKVKINHPTGKKKRRRKSLQYSIVIIHPKSYYRIGSQCFLKKSSKKERKNSQPHKVNVLLCMNNLERSLISY